MVSLLSPGSAGRPQLTRRALLGASVLVPSLSLVSGCSGATEAASPPPVSVDLTQPPAGRTIGPKDVRSFGAIGDGNADDTDALTRAFASLQTGQTLLLPAGHTFRHASVLAIRTPGVRLIGPGTLSATEEGASSLQILADNVTVDSVMLTTPQTTRRWSAPDQHKLYVGPVSGTVVRDVTIIGSAGAGLFSDGASNFRFEDVHVSATRADGIHMTNGSHSGSVTRPMVSHSGDDGVAVVSYEQDGKACSDLTVDSPVIRDLDGGRGLSVVGGSDVTYTNIDVEGSWAASVYIACEGDPYNTFPTTAVRVTGGSISNANTNTGTDHGAVLVYSGRSAGSVSDVVISGLTITGTRPAASRQIGAVSNGGGTVSDVQFSNLTLAATPTPYEGNVPVSDLTLTRVFAAGLPVLATLTK